ncbi:SGF29 tudor-like domain-containing protein [Vararia minispora EC-137]|uniref:SGF29 tudor-like domain-containing protein n=1 Tax=Vararia minispora EC-137 TaxID=1314806 RepID=A0ACB8QLD3_9AGAM|nr:SGF29 tudor-like domain-containing protein [Vararia minispora EC-137]
MPDTIGRVNRLISGLPSDETLPGENMTTLKETHKRLTAALTDIKTHSERDVKSIDEALEHLSILIGLRRASESAPPDTKRSKRPRVSSPAGRANTPSTPRGSVGPQGPPPFSREPKARREALSAQLPLQSGRMVAFHPPPAGKPNGTENGDTEDTTWILAKVVRCINQDKNRYEVQDIEPQDDGHSACYKTTLRALLPLPELDVSPNSPTHLNAYHEFPPGSTVLALYPDTSCFYRAEVLGSPSSTGRNPGAKIIPTYKLRFEDDDDQEHTVSAQFVVEWPGH